ncbi:MAG TPA: hypothetical protein VJ894_03885, partial [Cryomorphaceae bacterium]|nr:hypothetical protein [Cryomorphaceae bacterium]
MNVSLMLHRLGLSFFVSIFSLSSMAQLGTWRDHLNYNNALHLTILEDEVFVASDNGIFVYNRTSNDISRISKVNGLSDIGITALKADAEKGVVIIGYENGNLDIIRDKTITNFPAIKNSSVIGDKSIRHIYFFGTQAYISTGVGIISFNLNRFEVSDTFQLLPTGTPSINEVTVVNDTMFTATDDGLYKGAISEDLTVFGNWVLELSTPSPFEPVNNVSEVGGLLYVNYREGDNLGTYVRKNGQWEFINSGGDILELTESESGLVVNTSYYIDIKNPDGTSAYIVSQYETGSQMNASQAI